MLWSRGFPGTNTYEVEVIDGKAPEITMLVAMLLGKLIPDNSIGEVDMLYHMRRKK
jgi:hypothetical protein